MAWNKVVNAAVAAVLIMSTSSIDAQPSNNQVCLQGTSQDSLFFPKYYKGTLSCSSGVIASIASATYGSQSCKMLVSPGEATCGYDITSQVSKMCNGLQSCTIDTAKFLFPDDCGMAANLVVVADCTSPSVCGSGQSASLQCSSGVIGSITFADYGSVLGTCSSGFSQGSCSTANATAIAEEACLGQPSCTVSASAIGGPCGGLNAKVAIQATCVESSHLTTYSNCMSTMNNYVDPVETEKMCNCVNQTCSSPQCIPSTFSTCASNSLFQDCFSNPVEFGYTGVASGATSFCKCMQDAVVSASSNSQPLPSSAVSNCQSSPTTSSPGPSTSPTDVTPTASPSTNVNGTSISPTQASNANSSSSSGISTTAIIAIAVGVVVVVALAALAVVKINQWRKEEGDRDSGLGDVNQYHPTLTPSANPIVMTKKTSSSSFYNNNSARSFTGGVPPAAVSGDSLNMSNQRVNQMNHSNPLQHNAAAYEMYAAQNNSYPQYNHSHSNPVVSDNQITNNPAVYAQLNRSNSTPQQQVGYYSNQQSSMSRPYDNNNSLVSANLSITSTIMESRQSDSLYIDSRESDGSVYVDSRSSNSLASRPTDVRDSRASSLEL